MDITDELQEKSQLIEGYGDGGFTISGQRYEGDLLVLQDGITEWARQSNELSEDDFTDHEQKLASAEVIIIGTGAQMQFTPPALRSYFKKLGVSIDAMDSGAACRTYNILKGEGRKVLAAIIAVD